MSDEKRREQLRDAVAEHEHQQWVTWAESLLPELRQLAGHHLPYGKWQEAGNCGCKTCQRIKRWERLIRTPYEELTEAEKDQDRVWADSLLALEHGMGVVMVAEDQGLLDSPWGIEADREGTVMSNATLQTKGYYTAQYDMGQAGFRRTVPLVGQEGG